MTSTLTHEGYIAELTVDADAGVIHGEVINTRDVLTFSAKNPADLKAAFADTIEDYREWCASKGETPQKPLSGTVTLRMGPELHQAAANRAALRKQSLNQWIVCAIECDLGKRPANLTVHEVDYRVAAGVREEVVRVLTNKTVFGREAEAEFTAWEVDLGIAGRATMQ